MWTGSLDHVLRQLALARCVAFVLVTTETTFVVTMYPGLRLVRRIGGKGRFEVVAERERCRTHAAAARFQTCVMGDHLRLIPPKAHCCAPLGSLIGKGQASSKASTATSTNHSTSQNASLACSYTQDVVGSQHPQADLAYDGSR